MVVASSGQTGTGAAILNAFTRHSGECFIVTSLCLRRAHCTCIKLHAYILASRYLQTLLEFLCYLPQSFVS